MSPEIIGGGGIGNQPDSVRFGTGKPQEITDDKSFDQQASKAIDVAIKKAADRPLNQRPLEGGR